MFSIQRRLNRRALVCALLAGCVWVRSAAADLDLTTVMSWPGHYRGAPRAIAAADSHAYVVDEVGGVSIYDISDPLHPQPSGAISTTARAVTVAGKYLYLAGYVLEVFDLSTPADPRRVGSLTFTNSTDALTIAGDYAYVAQRRFSGVERGRLQLVDVRNPESLGGGLDTEGVIRGIAAAGDYVYLAEIDSAAW